MTDREQHYLRWSKAGLWVTPICCLLFIGVAQFVGRIVAVPSAVYWIVIGLLGFAWIGDLINVFYLRRAGRRKV